MKKGFVNSFIAGLYDVRYGEHYQKIIQYFVPELVSAFLLYSLPFWVDAYFISCLHSTSSYATAGVTNTLLHLITKAAEAFSVGTLILTGQHNGAHDFRQAGRTLTNSFWISFIIGVFLSVFIYFGAPWILWFLNVSDDISAVGIPYLQFRAIGILFTFLYFAFVGFLRGIKNTKTPMQIFAIGSVVFIIFDYGFIFGHGGLPAYGLNGSAFATLVQYAVMVLLALAYCLTVPDVRKYAIQLFTGIDIWQIKEIIILSWPVAIDKSILAIAYIWLCKMMGTMGTNVVAAFTVVRDMERFAFLPAVALAQIVTFLVSNDIGAHNWRGAKSNIKKVFLLAVTMVFLILLVFSLIPRWIVQIFDHQGDFTVFAAHVFPAVSVLVFFDLLQLILAGALRGAANVRIVMWARILFLCYFVPVSYALSLIPMRYDVKFIIIYSSFYIGNALMSVVYAYWFRSGLWKKTAEVPE